MPIAAIWKATPAIVLGVNTPVVMKNAANGDIFEMRSRDLFTLRFQMKKLYCLMMIVFMAFSPLYSFASELPDTYGNRLVAARNYLEVASMKDMVRDMIAETAKNFPEDIRQQYIQYMTKFIRVDVLESTAMASMARHFTLKELNALAAFYGSPEGRSAMKKFGAYMGDLMPIIQQEVLNAQQKIANELQKK